MDVEDEIPLKPVPYETLKDIYAQEVAEKKHSEHDKSQVLYEERGFCREGGEGDGYWNKKKYSPYAIYILISHSSLHHFRMYS